MPHQTVRFILYHDHFVVLQFLVLLIQIDFDSLSNGQNSVSCSVQCSAETVVYPDPSFSQGKGSGDDYKSSSLATGTRSCRKL